MITLGTELAKQCDHHGLKNGQYQRRKREKKKGAIYFCLSQPLPEGWCPQSDIKRL